MTMPVRKIDFVPEPARKAYDEADMRIEAANARQESELRAADTLRFERGYN
jgi:hypothetical protein